MIRAAYLTVMASLALPVCGEAAMAATGPAGPPPGLKITDAWFGRPANGPSLGFFTIGNNGPKAVLMTGWSSPACAAIEFHEASDIREGPGTPVLNRVTVPPEQTLAFVHGGYHLTCRHPTSALTVGAHVPVTISFIDGSHLTTPFEVRAVPDLPAGQKQALNPAAPRNGGT